MEISHDVLWAALDNLANARSISCSRMAVLSNLDATSFNKSKRFDSYGRPHWPSAETLYKVFKAMNITWVEFAQYFPKNRHSHEK